MQFTRDQKANARSIYSEEVDLIVVTPGTMCPQVVRTSADKTFMTKLRSERYDAQWCGRRGKQWRDSEIYSMGNNLYMIMPSEEEARLVYRNTRKPKHQNNYLAGSILNVITGGFTGNIQGVVYIVQFVEVNDEEDEGHEVYEDISEENKRRILEWDHDEEEEEEEERVIYFDDVIPFE